MSYEKSCIITGDQTLEGNRIETGNSRRQNKKRKQDNNPEDEDQDGTENVTTPPQNKNKQAIRW